MEESIDELYFNWLHAKATLGAVPSKSYSLLLGVLHDTEFVWLLPGDDNRAEDGRELREEFLDEANLEVDGSWFGAGCSILEMLVAFAYRAEFQTDIRPSEWFWQFVSNLGLSDSYDEAFDAEEVSARLYDFVWRTYGEDGSGGLFPMENPPEDQRKVEIWYQFCEYLVERQLA